MNNQKTIVDKIFEILLSFSVLGMAFILVVGVFARTVLNSSLTFTEEVGIWLNIAVTFLGIGYCANEIRTPCPALRKTMSLTKPSSVALMNRSGSLRESFTNSGLSTA